MSNNEQDYSTFSAEGDKVPFGDFANAHSMGLCHKEPYGRDIDGVTSSRPSFTRSDYEYLHPSEHLPHTACDIALECQRGYEQVGIVRNVIDLMVDFAVSGINIIHPNKRNQEWYQNWFNRVRGQEISESLVRNLLVYGRFIVREEDHITLTRRRTKDIQNNKAEAKVIQPHKKVTRRIPGGYTCLNPCMIDVLGGPASTLTNEEPTYGIRLPYHMRELIKKPKTKEEKALVASLPPEFRKVDATGFVEFDNADLKIVHYKKDDWQVWAKPIIYSILPDIRLLNKLRLADFNILDSAMDMVRIIKIGNLEHKIIPEAPAFDKLSKALQASNPGGIRTLLWTPDIEMEESKLQGYDILGSEKYVATNNRIHAGLGVPPTLTGSASTSGSTNNLTSLKTLVKRLVYVRRKLSEFWLSEFEEVRKARGHRICPTIDFDILNLGDEEAEKKIWIDLFDRNVISQEWLQVKMSANPEVEQARQNREHKERINKKRVPRSTPALHDPEKEEKCKKSLVEQGKLDPRALNLTGVEEEQYIDPEDAEDSSPSKEGDDNLVNRNKGGRPSGSKDERPRKKRAFRPVVRASKIWLEKAQEKIEGLVNAAVLVEFDKKNMRSLSSEETSAVEKIRCCALFNLPIKENNSEQEIVQALSEGVPPLYDYYLECVASLTNELGRSMTMSEKKDLQTEIYIDTFIS